jgi:hypothetical protein
MHGKLNMQAQSLFYAFDATGSNFVRTPVIDWEGGDGWLVVQGSFTGSPSLTSFSVGVPAGASFVGVAIDLPSITAPGTYQFTAPKGALQGVLSLASGDSVSGMTVYAVASR